MSGYKGAYALDNLSMYLVTGAGITASATTLKSCVVIPLARFGAVVTGGVAAGAKVVAPDGLNRI